MSLVASRALAQRVVLVRPVTSEPQALAAFAHLQGELTVHAFEVRAVDGPSESGAELELQRIALAENADAVILLSRQREGVFARIWSGDAPDGSGPTRVLEMSSRPEGPRALAVQVVDTLSAILREPQAAREAKTPERRPVPAPDGPPPSATPELPTKAPARWLLEGSVVAQMDREGTGLALGPSLGLGARLTTRLTLLALVQAPLLGAHHTADHASTTVSQAQAWLELRAQLGSTGPFTVHALAFVGTEHLSVHGKAMAPYLPERDATWTALVGLGLGGTLRLLGPLSLVMAARALLLFPRPVIYVGDDQVALGRPMFQLTAGLHVSL
jgi:hypothetical protein